jgi:hypothetical protein
MKFLGYKFVLSRYPNFFERDVLAVMNYTFTSDNFRKRVAQACLRDKIDIYKGIRCFFVSVRK